MQTDHDLLVEIKTELKFMREQLDKKFMELGVASSDHETRIRRLETWGFTAIGALGVIQFLVNYVK